MKRKQYIWMMALSLICSFAVLPVCIAQEAEDNNSEKKQELLSLKEKQSQILSQYNQDKKNLKTAYQEKLNALDDSQENRSTRVQLISEMKQKQAELRRAFQSDLRSAQQAEHKIRQADRPYANAGYVQAISEKQQRKSLRQRIKEQDEIYGKEFDDKFKNKKQSWEDFNRSIKSKQKKQYTGSKKKTKHSTSFSGSSSRSSSGSGYSY